VGQQQQQPAAAAAGSQQEQQQAATAKYLQVRGCFYWHTPTHVGLYASGNRCCCCCCCCLHALLLLRRSLLLCTHHSQVDLVRVLVSKELLSHTW
jgi:hypothetical protein